MGPCCGVLKGREELSHDSICSTVRPEVPPQEGTPVCEPEDGA